VPRRGAVDDADQGVQRQFPHPRQQVASGIKLLGRNHSPSQRQHAQRLLGQASFSAAKRSRILSSSGITTS
jgi:hypothetical protein